MKLEEAIKSGKRFRKKGWDEWCWVNKDGAVTDGIGELNLRDDLFEDDWEVEQAIKRPANQLQSFMNGDPLNSEEAGEIVEYIEYLEDLAGLSLSCERGWKSLLDEVVTFHQFIDKDLQICNKLGDKIHEKTREMHTYLGVDKKVFHRVDTPLVYNTGPVILQIWTWIEDTCNGSNNRTK